MNELDASRHPVTEDELDRLQKLLDSPADLIAVKEVARLIFANVSVSMTLTFVRLMCGDLGKLIAGDGLSEEKNAEIDTIIRQAKEEVYGNK